MQIILSALFYRLGSGPHSTDEETEAELTSQATKHCTWGVRLVGSCGTTQVTSPWGRVGLGVGSTESGSGSYKQGSEMASLPFYMGLEVKLVYLFLI